MKLRNTENVRIITNNKPSLNIFCGKNLDHLSIWYAKRDNIEFQSILLKVLAETFESQTESQEKSYIRLLLIYVTVPSCKYHGRKGRTGVLKTKPPMLIINDHQHLQASKGKISKILNFENLIRVRIFNHIRLTPPTEQVKILNNHSKYRTHFRTTVKSQTQISNTHQFL